MRHTMTPWRRLAYAGAILMLVASLGASAAEGIAGTVIDTDGQPVARATVIAGNRTTRTNAQGHFQLGGLPPQTVELLVSKAGYATDTRHVAPSARGVRIVLHAPGTQELTVITVTGSPMPGDPLLQAADVDVVGSEEKNRIQATSLGDALDQLAGVDNIGTGNQAGKPVIRGLSGERIKLLANGIGVDNQQFGVRHMPTTDPFLADRLEVVRGANSVLYGSNAIGGAVNILPPEVPFDSALAGNTLLGFSSNNNQWDTGITAGAGGDHFGLSAGLVRRSGEEIDTPRVHTFFPPPPADPDDTDAPAYSGKLGFTDFDQINGAIAGGWRSDTLGTWTLRYSRWDDSHNFLLPPPAGRKPPAAGEEGIGQYIDNDQVQLTGNFQAGGITWKPKFNWQNNRRRSNAAGVPRQAGFDGDIDIEFDQYTARLEGEHGPVLGLDGGTVGLEYVTKDQDSRGATQLSPGGAVNNVAAFAFEEKEIGALLLQAGLRYDFHTVEGKTSQTANPSPSVVQAEREDYSVVTGSIGGSWRLSRHVAVAANIGRGFRAPSLFELYVAGQHGGVAAFQRGNPDLDPEQSLDTDLSLRWASPDLRMQATVYRNRIDDYIYTRDTGTTQSGLPVFVYDQGNAELTGIEFTIERQFTTWLAVNGAAEAVDGRLTDDGSDLPLLPADNLRVGFKITPPGAGLLAHPYLSTTLRYYAAKDAAPGEPFSQFDNAPFGTASTDSYALVDLGMGVAPHVLGRDVKLDLSVHNLLDEDYRAFLDTYKGYALSPGRDIRVTLQVPFGG